MKQAVFVLALSLVLAACQAAPPSTPEPEPEPDPLTVTIRDYYATDATKVLVLEDIIASEVVTLDVQADCYLMNPPGMTFARYMGTITVETQGSNRYLPVSGTPWDPGATSINCQSITGETSGGETVQIKLR